MFYEVILTFESADEILKCDHSDAHYAFLSSGTFCYAAQRISNIRTCGCGTVYYAVQGGSKF